MLDLFLIIYNLSVVIMLIGFWGLMVVRAHLLLVLMAVEIVIYAISTQLLVNSAILDDMTGQIFALFLLTVAAAESAIGLALLVVYKRIAGNLRNFYFSALKA